jgi:hypothetical protein
MWCAGGGLQYRLVVRDSFADPKISYFDPPHRSYMDYKNVLMN